MQSVAEIESNSRCRVLSFHESEVKVKVTQSCLTLCKPMDCNLWGFFVHGILQARTLEWVAISFSSRSSPLKDRTWVTCIAGRFFTVWVTREAHNFYVLGNFPKKSSAKEYSNYHIIAVISHASKVMLKILQGRLQWYMNRELPDVQAGFRKGRGTRNQMANICWIIKQAREFQKNIYFCFIDYAKAFDCRSQQTVENSERDGNTRPADLPLEKSVCMSGERSTSRLYIVTLLV